MDKDEKTRITKVLSMGTGKVLVGKIAVLTEDNHEAFDIYANTLLLLVGVVVEAAQGENKRRFIDEFIAMLYRNANIGLESDEKTTQGDIC